MSEGTGQFPGAIPSVSVVWLFIFLAALFWALFIYPYAIYPLILRLFSCPPVKPGTSKCRVSLLFCAYNEIVALPDKIANLRQLKAAQPELEIWVYDDSSTDGTSALLAQNADLLTVVPGAGRTGKAAGMKRLAAAASGDILVFTDANVLLASDAIDRLLPYYADPGVGGVCGTLHYITDASSSTSEVGSAYWRFDEKLRSLESATGDVMGADGSIFSVRKALYPSFPDTVLDDFTVSMSVIFAGKRLIKASDVLAYENSVSQRHEELNRKVRIGARAYHTHAFLRGQLRQMSARNRFKYISHKLLRWFGGLTIGLGTLFTLLAVAAVSLTAGAIALAGVAIASFAAYRASSGKLAKLGEAVIATFATQLGILQGMRGRTVATWSPAKSR